MILSKFYSYLFYFFKFLDFIVLVLQDSGYLFTLVSFKLCTYGGLHVSAVPTEAGRAMDPLEMALQGAVSHPA